MIDPIGNPQWGFCCPPVVRFGLVLTDTNNSGTTQEHFFQNSYPMIKHRKFCCVSIRGKKAKPGLSGPTSSNAMLTGESSLAEALREPGDFQKLL